MARRASIGLTLGSLAAASVLVGTELAWRASVPERPRERQRAELVDTSLALLRPCAHVAAGSNGARIVAAPTYEQPGFAYPLDKPPATLRIAVVGESSGVDLTAALRDVWRVVGEPDRIEILGCAVSGAALEHVVARARETLGYRPDVLIVVFGHNLRLTYPLSATRLRVLRLALRSRLLAGLLERTPFAADTYAPRTPAAAPRLARLEAWLGALAEQARPDGVELVLTTLAANLWMPPVAVHTAEDDRALAAARHLHARGGEPEAIRRLSEHLRTHARPQLSFTLGTWLARAGRAELAYPRLRAAIDAEEIEPDRAPSPLNALIRDLARKPGVRLLDAEAAARERARGGLPGWDVMSDHCHLRQKVWREIASRFLASLVPAVVTGDAAASMAGLVAPEPAAELRRVLDGLTDAQAERGGGRARRWADAARFAVASMARADADAARRAVAAYLGGIVYDGVATAPRRARLLVAIADGFHDTGQMLDARRLNALARTEGTAEPWIQLGLFETTAGNAEAALRAFAQAERIEPGRADVAALLESAGSSR